MATQALSVSPAKFFADNRSIAGFGNPAKALFTSIRELVENSLDAAESVNVLPEIKVRLRKPTSDELRELIGISDEIHKRLLELQGAPEESDSEQAETEPSAEIFELIVADNGSGMSYDEIPFLMGRVLTSTKYSLIQQRGRFGLGGKMVIIYSLMETNAPVEIWSARKKDPYVSHYLLKIDLIKNEPIIKLRKKIPKNKFRDPWNRPLEHGTIIKVFVLGDWRRSRRYILEYFKQMAIITPYATFIFEDPDGNIHAYERITDEMPSPPKPSKFHLQGIDAQTLSMLLKSSKAKTIKEFLIKEFQRIGPRTAEQFLHVVGIDPDTPLREIIRNEKIVAALVEVARKFKFKPPDPSCLSPLGTKLLEEGIKRVLNPEFVYVTQRKPFSYMGHPMIVEIGIAYGGNIPPGIHLYRFANRVPLLYKEKSDVSWKVLESIDWTRYGVKKDEDPVAVFVSVVSTRVPFSETSKDFIDDVDVLRREIKLGILEGLRRLREYINRKRRRELQLRRRRTFIHYAKNLVRSISSILKTDETLRDLPIHSEDFLFATLADLIELKVEKTSITEPEEEENINEQ
ncbi:MAG: DNA topoisomerase VI subunit B [Candidatus Njordarchaeales archaeon]